MQPKFKIGQQFLTPGRNPILCTITDIHTTYNLAGGVVKLRYMTEHKFMNQPVVDFETENSVAMGIARMEGKL